MQMDDPLEEIRKAIKAFKEKAYERKMCRRAKANDKYNPKCPKCGLRVLYCVYGYGPDKIEQYDRRGIMYRRMGCYIPQNRYTFICPDCHIGYDRKLKQIDDPYGIGE